MKTHKRHHGLRKICRHGPRQWSRCPDPWHLNFMWKGTAYRLSLDREAGRHLEDKAAA